MLEIQARQKFRSNGLIDDFVFYGKKRDYLGFASLVKSVVEESETLTLDTDSKISIEVSLNNEYSELFTSLQNNGNEYFSMSEWQERDIFKVIGNKTTLENLYQFLIDLSNRGEGYSYISEYSEITIYSKDSPECRLHVQDT